MERTQQTWVKKDQAYSFRTRKSKRFLFDPVNRMNNARVVGAGVRKILRAQLCMDAAKAVMGKNGTSVGGRHSDLGEDRCFADSLPGAIRTDCSLRRDQTADLDQVSQRARRKAAILFIGRLVDGKAPALAARVLAGGANAAKILGVFNANQSGFAQLALLGAGLRYCCLSWDARLPQQSSDQHSRETDWRTLICPANESTAKLPGVMRAQSVLLISLGLKSAVRS